MHVIRRVGVTVGGIIVLAATVALANAIHRQPARNQQFDVQVLELGQQTYTENCEPCHGNDGKGGGSVAHFLETTPTDLTGDTYTQMESVALEGVISATAKGVPDTDMPAFEEFLTEEEIFAVAAHVIAAFQVDSAQR